MSETFEEWWTIKQDMKDVPLDEYHIAFMKIARKTWNHQQQKISLEIQSNTKMKEEYRQLNKLYQSQSDRIKELEGELDRLNREGSSICQGWHFELETKDARIKELENFKRLNQKLNIKTAERIKELETKLSELEEGWANAVCNGKHKLREVNESLTSQLEKAEKKNEILKEAIKYREDSPTRIRLLKKLENMEKEG